MTKPKDNFSMALIDADIIAYRCSVSAQNEPQSVCATRVDDLMDYSLSQTVGFAMSGNFKAYLTGSNNFRYDIAKTHHYKGNRKDTEKPEHLAFARQHLIDNWGAEVIHDAEADDAIATQATKYGDTSVMVSQDKDFNTVKGWKYNFVNNNWRYDDEWSAMKYFYTQVLTGDTADNIVGIYRVGPVKANILIEHCETEKNLWEVCLKAYETSKEALLVKPEDRKEWVYNRVVENARLLHLRRYENELWEPPV